MARDKTETGIAGEFLVAYKLSEMGLATAPTLKSTKKIDLLVSDGTRAKMVQVKATDLKKTDWPCPLPEKALPDLVYVDDPPGPRKRRKGMTKAREALATARPASRRPRASPPRR